ncbi:MAG: hypothetical protein L6R43_17445 [Planctomycetes bacterium]|nr:hypothetical protein [Planctomycetota bacterium]
MGSRRGTAILLAAGGLLAALPRPPARAQEDLAALHAAEAKEADELMTLLYENPGDGAVLAAAAALRERCLRSGNLRSAEFLAGPLAREHPERLDDNRRWVEILVARGKRDRARAALREMVLGRPSDCSAPGMLADLLLEDGDPAAAMEVLAAHLREHPREAAPLYRRAWIALHAAGDRAAARAAVADMRAAAADPATAPAAASWLAENAALLEEEAAAMDRDGEALRSREALLDRGLLAAFAAALLLLAGAFRLARPRP